MSGADKPAVCVVFVCQAGELELKSALLAASLRKAGLDPEMELVAAVPDESVWGRPSDATLSLLAQLGVRVEPVPSPFGRDYPIGNKISALGVATNAPVTAFLDSDILCLRPLAASSLATRGVRAKPADFRTFGSRPDEWRKVYGAFGLAVPRATVMSTIGREAMPPYFNAGVVAARGGRGFADRWLQTAQAIDRDPGIENKRPWLDQIALPVAAVLLGHGIELLTEEFNFPAHERCLDDRSMPTLCHYHWPEVVEQEAFLSGRVHELALAFPALRELMRRHPGWEGVSARATTVAPARGGREPATGNRDFLVTGMPWSGSSRLANLLRGSPEIVLVNDPEELGWALSGADFARRLELLYRSLRTGVVLDRGTKTRLDDRLEVSEDLLGALYLTRESGAANVEFGLGTRNSMAYLTRLRNLCRESPELRKIATVRHPLGTVAHWKRLPAQLEHAYVELLAYDERDGLVDDFQRQAAAQIRAEASPAARRARLWTYLAEIVWRDRESLLAVRFEDLAEDPQGELARIGDFLDLEQRAAPSPAPQVSGAAETALDGRERELTVSICGETMAKWGYR